MMRESGEVNPWDHLPWCFRVSPVLLGRRSEEWAVALVPPPQRMHQFNWWSVLCCLSTFTGLYCVIYLHLLVFYVLFFYVYWLLLLSIYIYWPLLLSVYIYWHLLCHLSTFTGLYCVIYLRLLVFKGEMKYSSVSLEPQAGVFFPADAVKMLRLGRKVMPAILSVCEWSHKALGVQYVAVWEIICLLTTERAFLAL